jgi:hypothetical protein
VPEPDSDESDDEDDDYDGDGSDVGDNENAQPQRVSARACVCVLAECAVCSPSRLALRLRRSADNAPCEHLRACTQRTSVSCHSLSCVCTVALRLAKMQAYDQTMLHRRRWHYWYASLC